MKTLRTLCHLARADFLERTRSYGFLLVLALVVGAGYLLVPPEGASYLVLQVGLRRGIYNSAWIGLMFGLIAAMHLPLFGFYLVKNSVERDRQSGVGQVIATTATSKLTYVVGKWLSNLAVLALILAVLTAMAIIMQLVRAEDPTVRLWIFVAATWLMGLPVVAIAAAMAVLFETVSILRGGLGHVAYFFIWLAVLIGVLQGAFDEESRLARPGNDLYGFTRPVAEFQQQVLAVDPDADVGSGLIVPLRGRKASTLLWEGLSWTSGVVLERMMWLGLALVITVASAIPFDRFDPARTRLRPSRGGFFVRLLERRGARRGGVLARQELKERGSQGWATTARLTPLSSTPRQGRFLGVLVAELKLLLKGRNPVWYAGALGLAIACLVSPLKDVEQYLVPATWLWPILIWSQLGVREHRHNTGQMVFCVPRPIARQLPAMWLAGFLFTAIVGGGVWLRLALLGEALTLTAWFAGALFVPALALALGVWLGDGRAFEIAYALLWYLGVINRVPAFDYAGATSAGLEMGMPVVYLGIAVLLVVLALIGRWRRLRV
jgi:hypothetical protein